MYSTAKRLSSISVIVCALNIFAILLVIMGATTLEIESFALMMGIVMFLATSAIISLLLTLALRGLCQDLECEFESQTKKHQNINEQIRNLENKH